MLPFTLNKNIILSKVLSTSVLGTFMLLTLSIWMMGCSSNSLEEIESINLETKVLPISTSVNMVLHFSDSAELKVVLSAPLLQRFTGVKGEPYDLLPEGLQIDFYDSLGNVDGQVESKYAIYYPKKEILELSKDVIVSNNLGDRLNTEQLTWNSKTHRVKSDDFVKFTTEDEIIYGDGFEANQDLTDYTMNHIKGTIAVDDESVQ
jgi:LPS export ABC transporter protein LptC